MKHIMVDLETLSSNNNAAIISVGAIEFNPNTGDLGKSFYQVVDLEYNKIHKFDISPSTVMWWLSQSDEARKALTNPDTPPVSIEVMLDNFSRYWKSVGQKNYFWSHATFDSVVLRNAYEVAGIPTPWHYSTVVDIRTLVALSTKKTKAEVFSMPRKNYTHHNALDDAIYQAEYVVALWRDLYKEQE